MSKNKRELIILILIIYAGLNYCLYEFLVQPGLTALQNKKQQYSAKLQQLNTLEDKEKNLETLKSNLQKEEKEVGALDSLVIKDPDTLQLIYDFYTSCKKYNIKGDSISFQLMELQDSENKGTAAGNGKSGDNNTKMLRLSIDLKAAGNKKDIEKFLRNLNIVTNEKLNVINIKLNEQETVSNVQMGNATGSTGTDGTQEVLPDSTQNIGTAAVSTIQAADTAAINNTAPAVQSTGDYDIEINFYQYLLTDGTNSQDIKDYKFYNSKIGFNKIADMLK